MQRCLYVYIYTHIHTYIYIYIYIHVYVYMSLSLSIYIYIYIFIQTAKERSEEQPECSPEQPKVIHWASRMALRFSGSGV